jgi:hypothetical protein
LSRFDPALEFRATGKGEGVQERSTVEIYRLREGVDLALGLSFGTQALEGRCVGPDMVRVQPDLIICYDQHLGHTQSGSQLGQQTAEVWTGGGFGKVRPEEKAEMLTRDGLQTGGQAEKQSALRRLYRPWIWPKCPSLSPRDDLVNSELNIGEDENILESALSQNRVTLYRFSPVPLEARLSPAPDVVPHP